MRSRVSCLQELRLCEKIGQGKTSEVFLARDEKDSLYAVKQYFSASSAASASASRESVVLEDLGSHPHIPQIYLSTENALVMELLSHGELFGYISHGGELLDEALGQYYLKQLVEVIEFIHYNGYAHRDIKPENILLDSAFNLKLVDFGLTCSHQEDHPLEETCCITPVGTVGYMAPELIASITSQTSSASSSSSLHHPSIVQPFSAKKADVFSLGVVIFSLVSGFPPYFKAAVKSDPYYRFFSEKRTSIYWTSLARKFGKMYSPDFMELINGMLAYNPEERFDLHAVKTHPWLTRPHNILTAGQVQERMALIRVNIRAAAQNQLRDTEV